LREILGDIGSMTFLLFITLILPPASLLSAISIPTWQRLNGKRFNESLAVLKPWFWHIQWLSVSQLSAIGFAKRPRFNNVSTISIIMMLRVHTFFS
jgi:hypothetical protein